MHDPERWLVLEVRAPSGGETAGRRRALAAALLGLGGAAVEEREGALRTHVSAPDDPEAFLERARRRLARAVEGPGPELRWAWTEDRDWRRAWRQGLEPRRVGDRLLVAPSWSDPDAGPGDAVVRLDPGMAFGTAEHGTTRGALRLLERAVDPGDRVLDVGTGSGVLAVAAARLGAGAVVALETDPEAVRTARENAAVNDVGDRVRVVHLEATPELLRLVAPPAFDVVAANILAPVLVPMLEPFRAAAADDGRLILGGILEDEADETVRAADAAGWRLAGRDRDEGWWTGLFAPGPR